MKKVTRCGVWETNSSTSHSLIVLPKDEYERWSKSGDLYVCKDYWGFYWKDKPKKPEKGKLYTKEELLDIFAAAGWEFDKESYETIDDWFADEGFATYEMWENLELEEDFHTVTTPSGDEMVIECKYGTDY